MEDVGGTIEWAKGKLDAFPKAKRDLGPLLDALGGELGLVPRFDVGSDVFVSSFDPDHFWRVLVAHWRSQPSQQDLEWLGTEQLAKWNSLCPCAFK